MAEETLTLRMREVGAAGMARDVRRVSGSVHGLGDETKRTSDRTSLFSRVLKVMSARMLITAAATLALTAALTPMVALLAAAGAALGATMIPALLLGVGALLRFQKSSKTMGSAAHDLVIAFITIRDAFAKVTAAGADKIFRALFKAIYLVMPLLESMQPIFTQLGKVAGQAIVKLARAFAAMGPQIRRAFVASGPLISGLVGLIPLLTKAFLDLAIAGAPVLTLLIKGLAAFLRWLDPAIKAVDRWVKSAKGQKVIATVLKVIVIAAKWVASVFKNITGILWQLGKALWPLIKLLGQGLLLALWAISKGLEWANKNFWRIAPTVRAVANIAVKMINWIVDAVIWLSKHLGWTIPTVKWFARAIKNVWGAAKKAVDGMVAFHDWVDRAFANIKDTVGGPLGWLIHQLKRIVGWADHAFRSVHNVQKKANSIKGPSGIDVIRKIAGGQTGGLVARSGMAVVGEAGPEVVHLPRSAQIEPNGGWRPATVSGGTVVVNQDIWLDGLVLARSVHKHAVRKKATR